MHHIYQCHMNLLGSDVRPCSSFISLDSYGHGLNTHATCASATRPVAEAQENSDDTEYICNYH
jgi:hypothetical protein